MSLKQQFVGRHVTVTSPWVDTSLKQQSVGRHVTETTVWRVDMSPK